MDPGLSSEEGARGAPAVCPGWAQALRQRMAATVSLTQAADLSCIVLFGACIEGVILRDKYVGFYLQLIEISAVSLSFHK